LLANALTTPIALTIKHGNEFEQVFYGIKVLDEFNAKFLLLQHNM
jgi:hypothetical protein